MKTHKNQVEFSLKEKFSAIAHVNIPDVSHNSARWDCSSCYFLRKKVWAHFHQQLYNIQINLYFNSVVSSFLRWTYSKTGKQKLNYTNKFGPSKVSL